MPARLQPGEIRITSERQGVPISEVKLGKGN